MFIPQRINQLLEERRIKKVELCEKVNISTVTLNRTTEHGAEIGCIKLERIADFFQVPMDYFFDRDYKQPEPVNTIEKGIDLSSGNTINGINGNGNAITMSYNDQQREIEHLKILLKEKERMIQLLLHQQNIVLKDSDISD
ncbi:helix-turn-helix transcriptional regulator [uncultured Bacteroides sp.]|uniref:helix-turn-helix domain-containing protein n=1 Tax=uncultured Bacteroides sp. TaxID=162156 RepID=UPI002595AFCB|nr:helix-turn-helix transcriptional regulator [uncultured Bacteroides sp.]